MNLTNEESILLTHFLNGVENLPSDISMIHQKLKETFSPAIEEVQHDSFYTDPTDDIPADELKKLAVEYPNE